MQIRSKVVTSLILLIVLLSAGLKVILDQVVKPEFSELEQNQFLEDIHHIGSILAQESKRLEHQAYDWGVWDQAYQFANTRNLAFIESNLVESILDDLKIDQLFFIDSIGDVVWSMSNTADNIDYTPDLPSGSWPATNPVLSDNRVSSSGLFLTSQGPFILGRSIIADGENNAPRAGTIVMARKLTPELIHQLESTSSKAVTLREEQTPHWTSRVDLLDDDNARTTLVLPFINIQEQSLYLEQLQTRKISHQANSTILTVTLSTLAMGLIITLMVYLFLRQHILIPIGRLNKQAEAFGQNQRIDSFTTTTRDDEIGTLIKTFRQMADKILNYQSSLVREKQVLELVSLTDQLTGVANRRYLDQVLPERIVNSGSHQWLLVMLDLDHFKNINDRFGHDTGDLVLEQFTTILRRHIRLEDHCIRYGGEEFLLAMPDIDQNGARECCERIRQSVAAHRFGTEEQPINLTISQGFILFNQSESFSLEKLELLLSYADTALYAAKNSGRNCWIGIDGRKTELPTEHTEIMDMLQADRICILQPEKQSQTDWPNQ